MGEEISHHLKSQLKKLAPAHLYEAIQSDPTAEELKSLFGHLRTLYYSLVDYLPRRISDYPPDPGRVGYDWQEGTLMFTDLIGFTTLAEANAAYGREGAKILLELLNLYFSEMIEIISKSAGGLLEFTGDAMLVLFPKADQHREAERAVRAGLRMQRAMQHFDKIETDHGDYSLGIRVGIHTGRFLTANIGTQERMEYILLGKTVMKAKLAEGAGVRGRVCLSQETSEFVADKFQFEDGEPGTKLVVDSLTDDQLGEYDMTTIRRRASSMVLFDSSLDGLIQGIEESTGRLIPLAAHMPHQVLKTLVESTSRRKIPPSFPNPATVMVNLLGLSEGIDSCSSDEVTQLIKGYSTVFTQINNAAEAHRGVLKKVTCNLSGSDMAIYFGTPNIQDNDPALAVKTALEIRQIVETTPPFRVLGNPFILYCQIGVSCGQVFSAEIGETRGRREFNVLGDSINIAARLMNRAKKNQILTTEAIYRATHHSFQFEFLGDATLKGKTDSTPIYAVEGLDPE